MITPQRRAVAVRPTPGSSRARRRRRIYRGRPAPGLAHHAVAVAVPHERIRGMVVRHRCDPTSGIPLTFEAHRPSGRHQRRQPVISEGRGSAESGGLLALWTSPRRLSRPGDGVHGLGRPTFLRPTCYCPRCEHGNRREATAAPADAGPHRRHLARRQRHPGGDCQRLHNRESRDRGDRPRGRLPRRRGGLRPVSRVFGRRAPTSPAGGASRPRGRRDAGFNARSTVWGRWPGQAVPRSTGRSTPPSARFFLVTWVTAAGSGGTC